MKVFPFLRTRAARHLGGIVRDARCRAWSPPLELSEALEARMMLSTSSAGDTGYPDDLSDND